VQQVLLSPGFLIGLTTLLLNDFYLKHAFGNVVTGKLSDFAGLFIFPPFLAVFVRRKPHLVYFAVAGAFLVWKSPISEEIISLWNSLSLFRLGRTIDYTDYVALILLPMSYAYFHCLTEKAMAKTTWRQASVYCALGISIFAFTATSFEEDRHVGIDKQYRIKVTRSEFQRRLESLQSIREVQIEKTTDAWPKNQYPDVETQPNEYYLRFTILEKYCESNDLEVFASFEEREDEIFVDYVNVRYWCSTKPDADDKQRLTSLFENFFVDPIQRKH
jgi:hypothetical protein